MIIKPFKYLEFVGYFLGYLLMVILWVVLTTTYANANSTPPIIAVLPFLTLSMLFATLTGAVGGYLAFGEDKKFPPSATSIGHILLGFGAGLFFSRGSLELMGYLDSSDNVVLLASFLWAAIGYFILRLAVATVQSDAVARLLPRWLIRLLGGSK